MSEPAPCELRRQAIERVSEYLETILESPSAVRGKQLRGEGPVAEFETLLAFRAGFSHCLATSNATGGLLAVVAAADLQERKVIVPEKFWPGTSGALRFASTKTITVPITKLGTLNLTEVSRHLEKDQIAAIIAGEKEHLHGTASELRKLCHDAGCLYIDDSSWLPSSERSESSFSPADIQIISFGPGKPLTLGEGGAILTRDRSLYERVVALSQHPERCLVEGIDYDPHELPLNARIHPLAAVLGVTLLSASYPLYDH